ncbi:transposon Tf2-5 polyprotein [Striga asiatica]|uniref:Transposon Tf2-5 polyprotein n=1 Tax=Striga asiatica TaxID=4170 RepID=A0A5A7PKD7_STRAF|nr:transposon Tf2-5 polyprotein [Striga asiatica]
MRTKSGRVIIPNNESIQRDLQELLANLAPVSSDSANRYSDSQGDMANNSEEEVNNPPRHLLRDLAQPIIGPVTPCIQLGPAARNYELKTIHYNQLPSFHGLPNKDPLHFIREFYNVLQTFPLHNLKEDQLKMMCFPKILKDRAKAWFMTLAPDSLTTWERVYTKFIGKYYSHQKTQELRRGKRAGVHEVSSGRDMMAHQIAELTEQMRLLNARGGQPMQTMTVEACGSCEVQGHRSEVCPSVFDQDFASSTELHATATPSHFHPPTTDETELSSKQQQQQQQRGPMGGMQAQGAEPSSANQNDKLDKILPFMANSEQRGVNTDASIQRLGTQLGQLATRVGNIEADSDKGKLSIQPKEAKAITVLRSGMEVDNHVEMPKLDEPKPTDQPVETYEGVEKSTVTNSRKQKDGSKLHKSSNPFKPSIRFPSRLREEKQEQQFRDLYNMLSKVNVNLPLLDVIKNRPSYVKFFKDLVTKKRKFGDGEKVVFYEAASAMQHDLPKKERDPRGFVIQIALGNGKKLRGYRSIRYSKGVVEDVLVRVGKLIVPVDFVVLDVGDVQENRKDHTILLDRPFMATTNTLIDVKNGTLNMTVLGKSVSISVREAISSSSVHFMEECAFVDVTNPLVADEHHTPTQPTSELKELPRHLMYVFLDDEKQKPVIIFAELNRDEENELIEIILEKGAKPFRDSQRRLNSNMMEVVKKEVLKLYSEGLIYLVGDSEWFSPIHVVPKKGGITVIENEKKEMVPTRITTGWRMCIDYRRLNAVTKKDHFPLLFIDQILDRLSGH